MQAVQGRIVYDRTRECCQIDWRAMVPHSTAKLLGKKELDIHHLLPGIMPEDTIASHHATCCDRWAPRADMSRKVLPSSIVRLSSRRIAIFAYAFFEFEKVGLEAANPLIALLIRADEERLFLRWLGK